MVVFVFGCAAGTMKGRTGGGWGGELDVGIVGDCRGRRRLVDGVG